MNAGSDLHLFTMFPRLFSRGTWHCGLHACYLQVVVVGVLSQAPVEKGPGEVVHSILLAGDGLVHNLSHHVIMQEMVQVALHGVGLKQELLVVLLAWSVAHQHTPAVMAAGPEDIPEAELPNHKFAAADVRQGAGSGESGIDQREGRGRELGRRWEREEGGG